MFLFKTYRGFDTQGIDIGCKFRKVRALFLKCHSMGGD